jgi:hypothetical protein
MRGRAPDFVRAQSGLLYPSPAAGENHLRRITEGSGRDALLRRPPPPYPPPHAGEGREGQGETRGPRARGPV